MPWRHPKIAHARQSCLSIAPLATLSWSMATLPSSCPGLNPQSPPEPLLISCTSCPVHQQSVPEVSPKHGQTSPRIALPIVPTRCPWPTAGSLQPPPKQKVCFGLKLLSSAPQRHQTSSPLYLPLAALSQRRAAEGLTPTLTLISCVSPAHSRHMSPLVPRTTAGMLLPQGLCTGSSLSMDHSLPCSPSADLCSNIKTPPDHPVSLHDLGPDSL